MKVLIRFVLLQSCWKTPSRVPSFRVSYPLLYYNGYRPVSCRFQARLARSHHFIWCFPSLLSPETFLSHWTICRTCQGMSCPDITRRPSMKIVLTSTFTSTRTPIPFSAAVAGFLLYILYVTYWLEGQCFSLPQVRPCSFWCVAFVRCSTFPVHR